jgi:uncharacterized membrane protein YidH (DUF202 family)
MKNIARHLPHYLTLYGILFAGLLAFIIFSYDRLFQIGVLVAMAVGYVAWGIIHHAIHKNLHLSVVLEYLVVAALGLVVVLSLIFQS